MEWSLSSSRTRRAGVWGSLFVALLLAVAPVVGWPAGGVEAAGGRYIVVLKSGVDPTAKADALGKRYGFSATHVYRVALNGFAAATTQRRAALIARDPDVVMVGEDREVSIDAQTLPTGVDRIDADLVGAGDGGGAVDADVAVIDTGVDFNHPDLNVAGGTNCVGGLPGGDFSDGNGHGTHVAGTIGALDNEIGVVGVAPGARIWGVKVLSGSGSGFWSWVICGIDWVTAQGIPLANMSLGGRGADDGDCGRTDGDALHLAICNSVAAGTTYVVAAGNSADDAANHVPAAYDEVVTVSALADFDGKPGGQGTATCRADEDDTFANFSNFGKDVDIAAPGVCIRSTYKGGAYATLSGTSMATPHVTGALALGGYAVERDPIRGDRICGMPGDPDGINEGIANVGGTATRRCG